MTLSSSGELWRIPGVHLAFDFEKKVALAVWHDSVVFDAPDGHPATHNFLSSSRIQARAIGIAPGGGLTLGPILPIGPFSAGYYAFGPRAAYNPNQNEFLTTWAEGYWTVGDDTVTDLNANQKSEYIQVQDPFPANSRIVARRLSVDASTLTLTIVGAQFEVSLGAGATTAAPSGTDLTAIHPAILPDVSWDGGQYVFVWQTLEGLVTGNIESIGGTYELRHTFRSKSRSRYRLYGATGTALTSFTDHSDATYRFFIKGPTSTPTNLVDGSVAANLSGEKVYDSVPTDPMPRTASLVLPGADGVPGTADDVGVGTLMIWSVTTLVFNEPKSRVRARFLPTGATTAGIVWDVFSGDDQVVQRAQVAAGPSKDPNDTSVLSHFLVVFQSVKDIVWEGSRAVEYVGDIRGRMAEESGQASGPVLDVAVSDATQTYLSPAVAWGYETEQYFLSWTKTDTALWNPYSFGRSFHPKAWSMLDTPTQPAPGPLLTSVASVYPAVMTVSYSGLVSPASPFGTNFHALYAGQEDDFGANFVGGYAFPNPGSTFGSPEISMMPSSLAFGTPDASTMPASQSVTVKNSASGTSVLQWQAEADQSWVTLNATSGVLNSGQSQTLAVSVNPSGLPNGTYNAVLKVASPTATNSAQSVTITLSVGVPLTKGTTEQGSGEEDGGGGGCGSSVTATRGRSWSWLALFGLLLLAYFPRRRRTVATIDSAHSP